MCACVWECFETSTCTPFLHNASLYGTVYMHSKGTGKSPNRKGDRIMRLVFQLLDLTDSHSCVGPYGHDWQRCTFIYTRPVPHGN